MRHPLGLALCLVASVVLPPPAPSWAQDPSRQLRVFLDCERCFADYLREEIEFVDYVRDRAEAEVHVIITNAETGGGGREYSADFIGLGPLATANRRLRTVTAIADSDDTVRRQIGNTLRIGLLNFIAHDAVPEDLTVSVETVRQASRPAVVGDRWRNWVFSVRGSGSFEGEESQREVQTNGSISADRITPDWKITIGAETEQRNQHFDIDENGQDERVSVERHERELRWLAVKGFGEHWSAGVDGDIQTSTFENTKLAYSAAPAVEFNVFPYSAYTRRQLRLQYAIGVERAQYYEETLYGRTEETHPGHEISGAFEQTERWGSLDARVQWSQYLHDPALSRLEAEGEVSWRVARGFSISMEGSASRVRDQISLPRRGATAEEVLLELRQLRSGYEYRLSFGVTYTFGSIFSAIVNPRFGR